MPKSQAAILGGEPGHIVIAKSDKVCTFRRCHIESALPKPSPERERRLTGGICRQWNVNTAYLGSLTLPAPILESPISALRMAPVAIGAPLIVLKRAPQIEWKSWFDD